MKKNRQKQGHRPQRLDAQDLAAVRGGSDGVLYAQAIVGGGRVIVGGPAQPDKWLVE